MATALLSPFFWDVLLGCSSTWDAHTSTFSKICHHSRTCRTSILEDAICHRMNWCKFLWGNPCRAIDTFFHWDSCLCDFGFSALFTHSASWKNSEKDSAVSIPHAYGYRRKLQLSPLEHCPLVFHCQKTPRVLCPHCFVPWFLTMAFL